ILGRPSARGSLLSAGLSGRDAVFVTVIDRAAGAQRFTRLLRFGEPVQHVLDLSADTDGIVYLAVVLGEAGHAHLSVECLDERDGEPRGRIALPLSPLADDSFRDLAVHPNGGIVYAQRDAAGVSYTVHRCQ